MKNLIFTIALGLMVFSADLAFAQDFSGLDRSPADIAWLPANRQSPVIKVIYSRPQKNGRTLFGSDEALVPPGKIWRTGANETTEIIFLQDATFAGKKVKAGTYSLYTIPGDGKWTIVLNSKLNTWGHFQYDESQDVMRAEVSSRKYDGAELEAFTIQFKNPEDNKSIMYMAWGNTVVDIPVEY